MKYKCNSTYFHNLTSFFCLPGRYLCDYTYYTSLHLGQGRAAFIHVPPLGKPYSSQDLGRALQAAVQEMLKLLELDHEDSERCNHTNQHQHGHQWLTHNLSRLIKSHKWMLSRGGWYNCHVYLPVCVEKSNLTTAPVYCRPGLGLCMCGFERVSRRELLWVLVMSL